MIGGKATSDLCFHTAAVQLSDQSQPSYAGIIKQLRLAQGGEQARNLLIWGSTVQAVSRQWAAQQRNWLAGLTLLAEDMHLLLTTAAETERAPQAKVCSQGADIGSPASVLCPSRLISKMVILQPSGILGQSCHIVIELAFTMMCNSLSCHDCSI